jgi:very-short-patch-repair endonuclease
MPTPKPSLLTRAKQLRDNQTDTERFVWAKLRGRRFAGYKFRRQKHIAGYVVDFVNMEHNIILELDGSQHLQQTEYDKQRTLKLQQEGYLVLRYWNHVILTEWEVIEEVIWQALQARPSKFKK